MIWIKLRCCFWRWRAKLYFNKRFIDFIYTCFRWLCYYYLTGCRSNSHFDYNTFSHSRLYSIPTSGNMFLSMRPRWLYIVMLFLLQIIQRFFNYQQKYLQSNISKSAIYTTKIAQCLLHSVLLHRPQLYRASNTFPILQR